MHPDVVYILNQAESDIVPLGKNDGIFEAADYLDQLAKTHPDRTDFTRGVEDAAYNVRCSSDNDEWYNRIAAAPDDLSFNPDLFIAALGEVRTQSKPTGHSAAVETTRELYDGSDEVGVEAPDRDNYWEKDGVDQDYIDEEAFNLEVEAYNEAREYLAGVAFAASSLVLRFGVDPDPSWEPA